MTPVSISISCWPGGTSDMLILPSSSVGLHFDQAANSDAWLLGEILFSFSDQMETKLIRASWLSCLSVCDRGYSPTTWLITSLTNLQSPRDDLSSLCYKSLLCLCELQVASSCELSEELKSSVNPLMYLLHYVNCNVKQGAMFSHIFFTVFCTQTTSDIWLLTAMGIDTILIHSHVKWLWKSYTLVNTLIYLPL